MKTTHITKQRLYLEPFEPPAWLRNAHLQTMLPKLLARKAPRFRRVLVEDSLGESQVAYDYYDGVNTTDPKDDDGRYQTPIVVLFHGLEGSSQSHYACTLAHRVHEYGWHFVSPHYRSCGGVPAQGDVFYNAGDTVEVHHVLKELQTSYRTIYAVGISLGGNMLAKYLGDYGDQAICHAAVVASAPVDLASSSVAMERFIGRHVYTPYLLNPLIAKALNTNLTRDEVKEIKASKRICDFDHVFTAPRHGFRSMNDYYRQASALPVLIDITKPTLMITSMDDPFLGMTATPEDVSNSMTLINTKHGGHIGFIRYLPYHTKRSHSHITDQQTQYQPRLQSKFNKKFKRGHFDLNWLPDSSLSFFQQLQQI